MKKVCLAALCLLLAGCQRIGQGRQEAVLPQSEETDKTAQTMKCTSDAGSYEFHAAGDQLERSSQTTNVSFEELGVEGSTDTGKLAEAIDRALAEAYGHLEGVESKGEVVDGHVRMTVSIDYATADDQALIDAGLLEPGEVETQYVSLEKTRGELQDQGYVCEIS